MRCEPRAKGESYGKMSFLVYRVFRFSPMITLASFDFGRPNALCGCLRSFAISLSTAIGRRKFALTLTFYMTNYFTGFTENRSFVERASI